MKKNILTFALITIGFCANAQQEIKFGPKAGVNFSTISNTPKSKMLTGFYVGAVSEIKFSENFSLQPELVYSSQGAKNEYTETNLGITSHHKNHDKIEYINIPILAKYYIYEDLSIELGPQFGFLVKAENKDEISINNNTTKENTDFKNEINSFDFSIGVGLAYDLANGFFINARYNFGLTGIGKSNQYYKDSKNGVTQIGIGYKF